MGLIVFDTAVLVDHLRKSVPAYQAWQAAVEDGHHFLASVVTKAELLAGMRSHERTASRELMQAMQWIDVSDEIAEIAGAHARRFRGSHQGVGLLDYIIGATAEHLGADLWTRNVRHFPMFPDLEPPY